MGGSRRFTLTMPRFDHKIPREFSSSHFTPPVSSSHLYLVSVKPGAWQTDPSKGCVAATNAIESLHS